MSFDPVELAVPGVRGLAPYEPGKPIATLAREYGLDPASIVKLASNENPRGPSPRAIEAARSAAGSVHRYPDGSATELRARLAARHGVEPAQVTVGNGSNDVLDMIARAFLGPGRSAVFSRHAFAVYPIATQLAGAEARVAAARPADDPEAPYGHDLDALAASIGEDTRVVFIANPNNPTGTWLDSGALRAFLGRLPAHVVAVVDEAYFECADIDGYPDASAWLDALPNLVVTRSFSKVHGLAGLRCGYAVSSAAIADLLNRVRHPFNANAAALAAAVAALDDAAFLAESVAINSAGRARLTTGLQALDLAPIPSAGNFVTAGLGREAAPVYEALLREGVIVRPVAGYELPNHLRISVGVAHENERMLAALERVLSA